MGQEQTSGLERKFLTAGDVAARCSVDLKTIHNWADSGKIPHFRTPGRHLRFHPADVLAFLASMGFVKSAPGATLGQIGYEAYGTAAGWKTFDNRPMPAWEDCGDETRRRWEVAALAVLGAR